MFIMNALCDITTLSSEVLQLQPLHLLDDITTIATGMLKLPQLIAGVHVCFSDLNHLKGQLPQTQEYFFPFPVVPFILQSSFGVS